MTLESLKTRLGGTIISAFEPGLAEAADSLIWNGRKPAHRVKLIVRAASAADVQHAVRHAAEAGLTVSARGGGHGFSGIAVGADMVIDVSALDRLSLDPAHMSARVEPGVTNGRMAAALERQGLSFPLGHCSSVPMSGYLLGGGLGWNSAEWGFACFSVQAVEVVLADGSLVTASAEDHPDVFWAARGAGPAFFGIVTAYHVRLQPAANAISTGVRIFPGTMAGPVADWAETVMASAPACVEFTAKVTRTDLGVAIAAIATVFAASAPEGVAIHDALWRDAPPAVEQIGPFPSTFTALYEAPDASMPVGRRYAVDSVWSDGGYAPLLSEMVAAVARAPSPDSSSLLVLRPNAVATPDIAAFSCHGRVFAELQAVWEEPTEDAENTAWLRHAIDRVTPVCSGSYVGEADLGRSDRALPVHSPAVTERLADLRVRHDPRQLFVTLPSPMRTAAE